MFPLECIVRGYLAGSAWREYRSSGQMTGLNLPTGLQLADKLPEPTLELYRQAAIYAETKGIIIADTKFEFGLVDGYIVLADEVLTPDSSRFWYLQDWIPGTNPPSLDKQFLRDWLDDNGWNHNPPPPQLPDVIIQTTRKRYINAYEILTDKVL